MVCPAVESDVVVAEAGFRRCGEDAGVELDSTRKSFGEVVEDEGAPARLDQTDGSADPGGVSERNAGRDRERVRAAYRDARVAEATKTVGAVERDRPDLQTRPEREDSAGAAEYASSAKVGLFPQATLLAPPSVVQLVLVVFQVPPPPWTPVRSRCPTYRSPHAHGPVPNRAKAAKNVQIRKAVFRV